MQPDLTAFAHACIVQGWEKPADFLRAFQMTADILGEPVTLTDRQVRRWRQPNPPAPRAKAWRTLHAMFGLCPTELGFPGPPPSATVGLAAHPAQKGIPVAMDRRAFLADSVGVTAALGMPAHTRPMTPLGASGSVGTAHLTELRAGLRSLFHLDDAYGGGDVRSLAVRHLRRVRRVINTGQYPDTIGRQLQLLSGEIAEHCGWLYYDADDQESARRYFGEALTTATMLRDTNLEILIFSSMSLQACHEGRARDGLDLARAAQERATSLGSPVLQSLIAAREARALALMGDGATANSRLGTAMKLMTRKGRPSPEWTAFHGPAELEYAQGLLYSELGHHSAATQFLSAALQHQETTYGRNRALYRITLAKNLIAAGEVDEGAAHAVGSLEHLEEVESGRVTKRLAEVAGALGNVEAASAREAAGELAEYVRARGAA
ncbi:hypothetical protein [Streptomyces sp. NBC_00091]|uniref:hypothetical protein n=1 Tax=Streptomyces sp. NBC_00091 TaxID=2975648 RepID=UPI00224CDC8E|nr:hypothetical protein [Streptomyces sp. NBC_00091]MCX5375918.1 hypothetical protein [Streptomyces sp. NBC_00091]